MARTHGRIMASIWDDADFLALDEGSQRMFMFLLSQPDLSHAGLIPLRERRWARKAQHMSSGTIRDRLDSLAAKRFVIFDEDTEEVLIRTMVRNDGVYKQPKVMIRLREDAKQIESPLLRSAFREELDRLPLQELADQTRAAVEVVVAHLIEDFGDISAGRYPSERVSDTPGDGTGEAIEGVVDTPHVRAGAFPLPPTPYPQPPATTLFVSEADATDAPPKSLALVADNRPDVDRICEHLANEIEGNGSPRPDIGKGWRDSARLMIDKDGRTEEEIHGAIDWCQRDEFWRGNILSLPKLREKYDQLRLQAQRPASGRKSRNEESRTRHEAAMARAVEREREMGLR